MFTKIDLSTQQSEALINLTPQVQAVVQSSGVQEGICVVFVPHTTAAITVNSAMDPRTATDIIGDVHRLVPTRVDFNHIYDTPADAAGHIKATLIGNSVTLIISGGKLMLGGSQSVLFFEFDGPRQRQVWVRVMRESD